MFYPDSENQALDRCLSKRVDMAKPQTKILEISPAESGSQNIRVVTAARLFDGHDVAINIMRRILQSSGAEVIHLGHNRSVEEIVEAAIQEDANGIGISY